MILKYLLLVGIISILIIMVYKVYNEILNNNGNEGNSLTSRLSLEQVENILGSELVGENKVLMTESIDTLNKSLDMIKNISAGLTQINTKKDIKIPEFLKNPQNSSLKIAKSDLELYISKYRELSTELNKITSSTSKVLDNISSKLDKLKKEENTILSKFEELSKKLCLPLILVENEFNSTGTDGPGDDNKEKNRIRRLGLFDEVDIYKEAYGKFSGEFKTEVNNPFQSNNQETFNLLKDLRDALPNVLLEPFAAIFEVDDLSEELNPDNMHKVLTDTKKKFKLLKDEAEKKEYLKEKSIEKVKDFVSKNKIDLSGFIEKKDRFLKNIKSMADSIIDKVIGHKKERNETNIDVPKFDVSFDISTDSVKTMDSIFETIIDYKETTKKQLGKIISLINVEEKTSLDLLFVMDITGSMGYYIEEAKENVLEIINRIITECPGIDINLGFIGYRDIYELEYGFYTDVNFTQNYTGVKEIIQNVYASGGGDAPEDVSWAMENALNKDWKNNARFLVFIADALDHGIEDARIPGRKNLTETIKELAENNVSLFCMKISYYTDKMLQMFENVYKNYDKCKFLIVDMMDYETLFTDAIVNEATKVYESQRNVDIK